MKILLIGPDHDGGSIPPYLDVLAHGLRAQGAHVDRLGSDGVPYDEHEAGFWSAERIITQARTLLTDVDAGTYDVVSIHFGNLEIEQLLPHLWKQDQRPPIVYSVHSLDWTLFTDHVPDPDLSDRVRAGIRAMDGFVYFGGYARQVLEARWASQPPGRVAYLPTTIPPHELTPADDTKRMGTPPVASLYGYPSTWKHVEGLLEAFGRMREPMRFVLAGPRWDNPDESGVQLHPGKSFYGPVEVRVQPEYVGVRERVALMSESDLAIFPYQEIPTFQGSGAIADYLVHGIPVLATDVANMAELIGPGGIIVPPDDPAALATALDRFASDHAYRRSLVKRARERSHEFHPENHAAACLSFFREVVATHR